MHIKQKRIRNVEKFLSTFKAKEELYVGLVDTSSHKRQLMKIGFSATLTKGEKVLPRIVGTVSEYNAEGKEIVRKDLPKETAYRQLEWHWKEWDGTPHSRIVDVPYERYPRDFVPPPSEELEIVSDAKGNNLVVSRRLVNSKANRESITHLINLFLEIFGECELLPKSLKPIVPAPKVKRLNWQVLPQGRYPWEKVDKLVKPILDQAAKGNVPVIASRLKRIARENPEFVAIGTAGYHGYVVFGFPKKKLFILESAYYGNATYVFDQPWEKLSQLTKAEILESSLNKDRIIHREGWDHRVAALFK